MSMDQSVTMSVDDEMPWFDLFKGREDFYDDIGFAFVGETDEVDIMLGNFFYLKRGGKEFPGGQWLTNGIPHNDFVVITPKDQRGKPMADNNFSRTGMNSFEFYSFDDLHVERTEDSVTWRLGEMEYVCAPPHWHMRGRHGENEYDIKFEQIAGTPISWSAGRREDALKNGMAGGYAFVQATGTLTVEGKKYELKNARGVHERLAFSQAFDPVQNSARDHSGYGATFALYFLTGDVWCWITGFYDDPDFHLRVEGKDIYIHPGRDDVQTELEYLEPWHDKRSGMYMPSHWKVRMSCPEGKLELDVKGLGRGFYPWEFKRGYQMMYWVTCLVNGSFTWADGRVVEIRDQLAQHEICKIIMVHRELMSGRDTTSFFDSPKPALTDAA